ncbi:MAG: Eco57I restriction-modification methylase domain-containing protein [Acidobacteria bacterium]|nr:Eco57I restriction-modification methylase domain-containing protein [Acidobacteriota bacterium]
MTTLNIPRTRNLLQKFDFKTLFIEELGWDRNRSTLPVLVDGKSFQLSAVAHKRGFAVFLCEITAGQSLDYQTRRKIEQQVVKSAFEHLIIFVDTAQGVQIWQWVKRERGKPTACREHTYHINQPGDALIQKLQTLVFTLDEEESLGLLDVTQRARDAFDLERMTKRFYDRFKTEHDAFFNFIAGIPDAEMHRWYTSVMLNRLMFIYFIQKKNFLDNNPDYLRKKLEVSRQTGKDQYYTEFLCPLFFEGFAKKEGDRSAAARQMLGQVPYLNGGLFMKHQIEELHGEKIQIADIAFERLFDFFDQYQWHLDERPSRHDNEINPDVLGYIFEKYINQKQMGAYYTKEDITEYIGKNTILPYLFDVARQKCKIAFEGETTVWKLLQNDPDRYIYDAVKKGVDQPLPDEIAVGLGDVAKRTEWNKSAPAEFALPTEIWREVVARHHRYEEIRTKLAAGEVRDINDLITLNLNIRQFAQDVIENAEGPELLRAFWQAIEKVTVLDPTCGSGAFLFAALNILEPLYDACLDRMQVFLDDLARSDHKHHPKTFSDFRETLETIDRHPNRRYFIFKSIIINNLFGVDIMDEAVEICKLRLFLKLVAQVEQVSDIEPLPDIDFNIRAGNTLVGFANYDEVKLAVTRKFDFDNAMGRIDEKAQDLDRLFKLFRQQQTELGGDVTPKDKKDLHDRLKELEDELNLYLAGEYAVKVDQKGAYETWLTSHKPFHWFIEFYGIIKDGGFDVVIGNPPYVEISTIRSVYKLIGFETDVCGNLYAPCIEQSFSLLQNTGRFGFVVQQPIVSTQRMKTVRDFLIRESSIVLSSTFDDRPSKLFDGMHHARIAILIAEKRPSVNSAVLYVTPYKKWYKEERDILFNSLSYFGPINRFDIGCFPKIRSKIEWNLVSKLFSMPRKFGELLVSQHTNYQIFYKITGVGHWFTITCRPPKFYREGTESSSTREETINFPTLTNRETAFALLNSTLFYWFYQVRTNCRDFNPSDYKIFPIPNRIEVIDLSDHSKRLQRKLDASSTLIQVTHSKTGAIQLEQFKPKEAKDIIDEIDRALAKHYGFTDEELDFIINYDIKYRMGRDSGDSED